MLKFANCQHRKKINLPIIFLIKGSKNQVKKEDVNKIENEEGSWTICPECQGRGKKSQRLSKKVRLLYQTALEQFEKTNGEGTAPVRPKAHLYT